LANFNKVILVGNLTRDPELRYTPANQAVANLGLAVNSNYTTASGEKREEVGFFRIVVWGRQAEACSQYLTKGRSVLVEGRLQSRSWETEDGQKRSAVDVVAERVQFLGGRTEEGGFERSQSPQREESPKKEFQKEEIKDEEEEEVPF